jgi:hypothetical protein
MASLVGSRNIRFLCYGSILGGFLSERWLGVTEPKEPFENRSLVKYKLIIDEALGGGITTIIAGGTGPAEGTKATGILRTQLRWIARGTEPRVSLRRNRSDAPDSQSADSNGTSVSTGHQVSEDERS